jgi:hypothetical protein
VRIQVFAENSKIHDALRERSREAREELAKIIEDIKGYSD